MDKRQKKGNLSVKIASVLLFIAVLALSYPTVSDYWNSFHQTRVVSDYTKTVSKLSDAEYKEVLQRAREFNASLVSKKTKTRQTEDERKEYESMLNVMDTGVMGYIEIPQMHISLPIYHGLEDMVLQTSVGHMVGTSLPVGGPSTHCVIGAHRGLPSAKLFTELDLLQVGDFFYLHILGETLTYKVDKISIIKPDDWSPLEIVTGKDYCSLLTCTPYGINTHRLVVRGERTDNPLDIRVLADALMLEPARVAVLLGVPILVGLFLFAIRPKDSPWKRYIRRLAIRRMKKEMRSGNEQAEDAKKHMP